MGLSVLIVEDEAPAFRRLQKILEELIPTIQIVDVIDSVEETVKWMRHHELPDLIFMDIQLSDGISFEIFDQVYVNKPVVFTTAFDEYTLRAFKVNSIDYLLKPIKKEELQKSLDKYQQLQQAYSHAIPDMAVLLKSIKVDAKRYKSRFLVKMGDKLITVEIDQVAYFYLHVGVVHMMTWEGRTYLLDYALDELQQQLDSALFFRANRQFILHLRSIMVVHKYHNGKLLAELKPKSIEQVIVSAEKSAEFKNWLADDH